MDLRDKVGEEKRAENRTLRNTSGEAMQVGFLK